MRTKPKFCQVLYCLEDNPTAAAVTDPDPGPARELFEVQQKMLTSLRVEPNVYKFLTAV